MTGVQTCALPICYADKLVEIHLDYFGRKTVRTLELYLDDDKILVDYMDNSVVFEGSHEAVSFHEGANDKYIKEMEYYLQLLEGKVENINNMDRAKETFKIAVGGNVF